jgi:hypothetical protein
LTLLLLLAGCTAPLAVEGARCPCPAGFRCDPAAGRCVPAEGPPVTPTMPAPDGGTGMSPPTACTDPGPTAVRRLSAEEYANTVLDLLGVVADTSSLPRDTGLPEQAGQLPTSPFLSPELAETFTRLADDVAARATTDPRRLLPCEPDPPGQTACARQFAERFGARAYRRPLTTQEVDELVAAFEEGRRSYGSDRGLRRLIQFALVSPAFLFRIEVGERAVPSAGVVPLTPWEIATRLSYFLWATMPDEALRVRAAAGNLRTREEVRAEAERLLDSPRAAAVVASFHRRWLGFEGVRDVAKDAAAEPSFDGAFREALVTSAQQTVGLRMWERPGDQAALFGGALVANRAMSEFYGLSLPAGTGFEELSPLGGQKRFGVLTLPAVLARLAKGGESHPVRRGIFVVSELLCREIPPPPAAIPPAPTPMPGATTRDALSEHSKNVACAACHAQFDAIGFGLENYDGYGRWRETENGKPIDASGGGALLGRAFDGPEGLAAILASSDEVSAASPASGSASPWAAPRCAPPTSAR